jgi:hypothetical protein
MKAKRPRKPRKDPIEEMAGEPLTKEEMRELRAIIAAVLLIFVIGIGFIVHFS